MWLWSTGNRSAIPVVLTGHADLVTALAFSLDGRQLVTGSADHTLRLWIARTAHLADLVCQRVRRNLTHDEWRQFMGNNVPYERTCPHLPPGPSAPAPTASAR